MRYPPSIQRLIDIFSTLPTVGQKTAERYVFYLLKKSQADLENFAQAITSLKGAIKSCRSCGSISETDPCQICSDVKRDHGLLCIVADYRDLITLETTGQYNGLYHILGGTINAIKGIGPEKLNIHKLTDKLKAKPPREAILALNPDMEGETTSMYLTKLIHAGFPKIKVTRLAKGLPMGADLEYADDVTLSNALKYRNEL